MRQPEHERGRAPDLAVRRVDERVDTCGRDAVGRRGRARQRAPMPSASCRLASSGVDDDPAPRTRVVRRRRDARGVHHAVEHLARHRLEQERADRAARLDERGDPHADVGRHRRFRRRRRASRARASAATWSVRHERVGDDGADAERFDLVGARRRPRSSITNASTQVAVALGHARRTRPRSRDRRASGRRDPSPRQPAIRLLMPTTRGCAATASRIPGTARIGAIDTIGLAGQITTASAGARASSTPGPGARRPHRRSAPRRTGGSQRSRTNHSSSAKSTGPSGIAAVMTVDDLVVGHREQRGTSRPQAAADVGGDRRTAARPPAAARCGTGGSRSRGRRC